MRGAVKSVWRLIGAVVAIGVAGTGLHAGDFGWPPADLALIHSARLWEIRDRGDLAQLALRKLIAARPDSPQAMVELGELDIRIGQLDGAAQVLTQLQQRFKDSLARRDFEIEYRLATRDRLQLALVRHMIDMRKDKQALESLHALVPNPVPGNAMGAEYYRILARIAGGWFAAFQGLRRLAAEHPDDPNYQLALARQMLSRPEYAVSGVMTLYRLAQRDDIRGGDVDELLAQAFRNLPARRIPPQVLRDYLKRHADDPLVLGLLAQQRRAIEQQQLLANDGLSAVEPALQQRLRQQLTQQLESPGADSVAQRLLLMLRMFGPPVQPEAVPLDRHFDDSALEAAVWWERAQRALSSQHLEIAAAEMQAALAFHTRDYEATIASAEQLESLGASAESGALLTGACQLDPRSNWLFETRLRWMIAHRQFDGAIALLQRRPIAGKWSADSRDALLALALDQRASGHYAAGEIEAAIADWQAALRLTPRDPWMRYRLATIDHSGHQDDQGVALMSEGVRQAPDEPQMRYAQALYLSSLEHYEAALVSLDAIPSAARTDAMNALHERLRVAQARQRARDLFLAGDRDGARAALLAVEPLAARDLDRARELAYAWLEIGDPQHGIGLIEPYAQGTGADSSAVLLSWAQILNSADDSTRLGAVLDTLHARGLSEPDRHELARLQRALDLRIVRELERDAQYQEAARRLDAMLAADPDDRALRVARAETDMSLGKPGLARDRLASLVTERPDDFDARLSYVRALTESGDLALARVQLASIQERIPADDFELQLSLARRQLGLGQANEALITLRPLLAKTPARADVLLLAARAASSQHHFALAREYFKQAADIAGAADALDARRAADEIQARMRSGLATALQVLHQPGVSGISQLDVVTVPSAWVFARGYEQRLIGHADLVSIDTGHLGGDYEHAALLGKVQAAGPTAALAYSNERQTGIALSGGYQTDTLAADVGTTPLGFDLPNIVGGVEWTPSWRSLDLTLGLARRAVTSSALSYAGLRDPVSGQKWGGVVANGPYAGIGLYRERFSLSGSIRFSELTGTHVPDNQFLGARASGSWKFYNHGDEASAYTGLVLNDWNYQHNLANYTFGSAGYYSPRSYLSTALPLELIGVKAGWSYQIRASIAYSVSSIAQESFYPDDAALQHAAARSPLPAGFDSPLFASSHGGAFSVSAYAAVERQVTRGLVLGAMLDIDRTDFYHPTVISLYLRHAFTAFDTPLAIPPRPTRPYNP
ncbi:MAG TPA: cellulose synthase subunit BcsC-related outer membrane protein [Steroidobacteraceae bacterium]|nr:cellulose synthase subunit BcsC-related outer membrane protein [Steroidobacteraceae bacterium]